MTRDAWIGIDSGSPVALFLFSGWLAFAALDSMASEDIDKVEVSMVRTYQARQIESGEITGHFLQVDANVRMSTATRAQLDFARAYPMVLTVRLQINGRHYLPCGGALGTVGSQLPLGLVPQLEKAGESISPHFFIPEGSLGDADVVELLTVLQVVDGNWPKSPVVPPGPSVARTEVPLTQELVEGAGAAALVEFIDAGTEERIDYKKTMGATRTMQAVRLHLSEELLRVVISGKMHCGSERAEDLTVGDPLIARFASPVDPLNCPWEIRFPDFGVKLELELTKP